MVFFLRLSCFSCLFPSRFHTLTSTDTQRYTSLPERICQTHRSNKQGEGTWTWFWLDPSLKTALPQTVFNKRNLPFDILSAITCTSYTFSKVSVLFFGPFCPRFLPVHVDVDKYIPWFLNVCLTLSFCSCIPWRSSKFPYFCWLIRALPLPPASSAYPHTPFCPLSKQKHLHAVCVWERLNTWIRLEQLAFQCVRFTANLSEQPLLSKRGFFFSISFLIFSLLDLYFWPQLTNLHLPPHPRLFLSSSSFRFQPQRLLVY